VDARVGVGLGVLLTKGRQELAKPPKPSVLEHLVSPKTVPVRRLPIGAEPSPMAASTLPAVVVSGQRYPSKETTAASPATAANVLDFEGRKRFARVPDSPHVRRLRPGQKAVFAALQLFTDQKTGVCFPNMRALANVAGLSVRHTRLPLAWRDQRTALGFA